jgi:glycine betaine/proline transport system substrate-binding protein
VIFALAAGGCGASKSANSSSGSSDISEDVRSQIQSEGAIEVLENNWTSQQVQTRLAHRVFEEMGADVTTTPIDYIASFPAMAGTDNMLHMEVWDLTAEPQMEQYVEKEKTVVDLGASGPSAEEGWYVPTYVFEGDEERGIEPSCPGLPNWEALNDCADVFATPSTGDQGRYLSGDPSWGKLYGDPQRIENLDLNYQMEFAGSEAALAAEFQRAYDRGEPILGLMWKPNWVTSAMDLTLVEFPAYTDKCWGTTYACGWSDINLLKLASKDFAANHPTSAAFVENYNLPDEELAAMLSKIEQDGVSVEDAVDEWMGDNTDLWMSWVPEEPVV